ncbi:MAG: MetQ/NlpA family ABC transporter substrate-binding protein [Eubacterium aggregans]|uniref:MetQ/NlpA family ABC transporter substrate-binding protein n=1 Tax=Eubacterium aggregans TaxID=81409 RepID=UPI0023F41319|nr:MetQ/NlpA family ABC transporter substrate-binding protein [Eubacterium aggregans]MDD4690656.1 MetQ/NlpA family ABC transporter substrate-binding protein [Eubacterium aggregans]MEA5073430.1 MetQ/NlpA family ABC transporter substrate-binding protein [Eubacterium aggregans]
MKRFTKVCAVVLAAGLLMTSLAGCGGGSSSSTDDKTIVVGASPTPHSEILKAAEEALKEKGYTLEIKEFTDYVQPNQALSNGELDANYFQHAPYLTDYNEKNGTDLVSAASIHYEPLGLYAGKTKAVTELSDGATIAVPNDTTNEARALLLLENQGLIKLKEGVGLAATPKDIAENPKNLKVQELEAAQLARSLGDVDMAVINGNYALDADLKVSDALAKEEKDSEAAKTYANIVAVRKGEENSDKTKALIDALKSESVQNYILNTYGGAVVPMD